MEYKIKLCKGYAIRVNAVVNGEMHS